MTSSQGSKSSASRRGWWFGLAVGVVLTAVVVLASGFMIETTNTDTFCITCHAMTPFRTSWQQAVHGGKNSQGFAAQCVDCHLPHGDFLEYVTAKAITGTGDVFQNLFLDLRNFDWLANAEKNRSVFTFDSSCRRCHHQLDAAPGMRRGGFLAHRAYLRGDTTKQCTECHPHVGHKDLEVMVQRFFKQKT